MKVEVGNEQEQWLEDENNLAKWEDGDFTASERRILISQWVGEVWERMCAKQASFIRRTFVKTGTGMSVTGEDDDQIQPEGTENYTFEGEVDLVAAAEAVAAAAADAPAAPVEGRADAEDASDVDSELGGLDSGDDDEPGDAPGETLAGALPDGTEVAPERPNVDASLVGTLVAVKWRVVGWCVGRVTKFHAKPRLKARLNVEVEYDDGSSGHRFRDECEHAADGGHYATADGAPFGSWVALRQRDAAE